MNIQVFFKRFPDESSCKAHFKLERDQQGVISKPKTQDFFDAQTSNYIQAQPVINGKPVVCGF